MTRSRFGAEYAVTDRYLPLSCYFWAAIGLWLLGSKPLLRGIFS